jgi:putative ABC transport system permease protein
MSRSLLDLIARVLLGLYPPAFRARFGPALRRDFVASCCEQPSVSHVAGNVCDLVLNSFAERRYLRHAQQPLPRAAFLERLVTDIRYALRNVLRHPLYSTVVVAILALGIGATTAVFSLVDGVLLKPLPYRDPDRLAFMWTKLAWIGVPRAWVAGPHVPLLANEARTIESIAAIRTGGTQLTGFGEPLMIRIGRATPNLFDVLGVRPSLGRALVDADRSAQVVVLTDKLWRSRFGANPAIVGRFIEIGSERHEVIGVLPQEFRFVVHSSLDDPVSVDAWTAADWDLASMSDGQMAFAALVRAGSDSDLTSVQAELDVIGERLDQERYKNRGFGWQIIPVKADLVSARRPGLLMVLGGAAAVLVIVCANVIGLGLVEAGRRRRELAVRAALGASRWRIVSGLVIESLALATAAGALGVLLAAAIVEMITGSSVLAMPRMDEVAIDRRAILFAAGLSLLAGVLIGLLPALRVSRPRLAAELRHGGRGATARGARARVVLIAGELALAVMLLAASGVLVRSLVALHRIDPAFVADGATTAEIVVPFARYPDEKMAWQFHQQLADKIRALPGVTAVGGTTSRPLSGDSDQANAVPEGWIAPEGQSSIMVDYMRSTPGYFSAMGITVQRGRDFQWTDAATGQRVAIVDETFARQAWPNQDPVGRVVTVEDTRLQVVGVARHARLYRLDADDRPQIYVPWTQDTTLGLTMVVRGTGEPGVLAGMLRQATWSLDPNQPVADIAPMTWHVDVALAERRLQLLVLAACALCAVLLSGIGLYGVISSSVAERTQEWGVRAALGSTPGELRRLVLRNSTALAAAGIGVGLAGALALGRVIERFAYGVSGRDPLSLALTVLGVFAVAVLAAYVPARRASRVDPLVALRQE